MLSETEKQQIGKALQGDRLAAERLLAAHRRMVLAVAYQALGNADDAQDVAQEALVYAIQRLGELRDHSQFAAWLRHITLSQCADYRRRRGTRRLGEPIAVLNEASEEADYVERYAIRQALAQLSEAHRTTLLLHYRGGWALNEVAALLDIPVNTVRSRLMTAKRHLRTDLQLFERTRPTRKTMLATDTSLSEARTALLDAAFPGARILSVQENTEPWMPFHPRVQLARADGTEITIDFRWDIDPVGAELIAVLKTLGIPGPQVLYGPVPDGNGGYRTLCTPPIGENLLLWSLGGTPHRIRLATDWTFDAIDRLQATTEALLAAPVGARLPRRTLADEADAILSDEKWRADSWQNAPESEVEAWRNDPWFRDALTKVRKVVADIDDPLVLTHYLHYFPNFLRIHPVENPFARNLEWLGGAEDMRRPDNPLAEFVSPYGYIGDPLLGLAMVWIYDCYPFVHTGFVEQFLWRRNISRRDFAPRLALQALRTIARQLPINRPAEGSSFWEACHVYVEQGLAWM